VISQAVSLGCTINGEEDVSGLAEEDREVDIDVDAEGDEPRIDVGSQTAPDAQAPVGIEEGSIIVPLSVVWVELQDTEVAQVVGGSVEATLANLSETPVTAGISIERSSGVERATGYHSTVVIEPGETSTIAVELLPADLDLGNVETALNLRLDATVVAGAGVEVNDEAALGHYQSSTLYFHGASDGSYAVYGEDALRETFAGGLVSPEGLAKGNEVAVPDGATLEAVVVGAEG
jgi:hypothetical protein